MALGRPKSISASSAARIVRPVYSTSSTSRMCRPSSENGISVRRTTGCGADRVPHQVVAIQRDVERAGRHVDARHRLMCAARRAAIGTPRARMPMNARSSMPLLRSRISCAMRAMDRDTRYASMTTGMATRTRSEPTARLQRVQRVQRRFDGFEEGVEGRDTNTGAGGYRMGTSSRPLRAELKSREILSTASLAYLFLVRRDVARPDGRW